MEPDQPPLPTASKFPFQVEAGIHTSILISESSEGFNVAATRQKGGCEPEVPLIRTGQAASSTEAASVMVVGKLERRERFARCGHGRRGERNQNGGGEFHLSSSGVAVFLYSLIGTCCAFITSSSASTVGGDGLKLPKR